MPHELNAETTTSLAPGGDTTGARWIAVCRGCWLPRPCRSVPQRVAFGRRLHRVSHGRQLFVHGYGLTWNVSERVQSYTNPLWLLLFTPFYFVTQNGFYTALFFSMAVSTCAVVLFVWKIARSDVAATLGVLTLTFSVAFVDYSTSGLENPLTHLLLGLFIWVYWTREVSVGSEARRSVAGIEGVPWLLSFLASLAALNRMDTILLFLPGLVHVLAVRRNCAASGRWRLARFRSCCGWAFRCSITGLPFPIRPTPS